MNGAFMLARAYPSLSCAPRNDRCGFLPRCRPGERRDPYRVIHRFKNTVRRPAITKYICGYGSRRSPGRRGARVSVRSKHLEIFAMLPVRHFRLKTLDLGVLDMDVVVHELGPQRLPE